MLLHTEQGTIFQGGSKVLVCILFCFIHKTLNSNGYARLLRTMIVFVIVAYPSSRRQRLNLCMCVTSRRSCLLGPHCTRDRIGPAGWWDGARSSTGPRQPAPPNAPDSVLCHPPGGLSLLVLKLVGVHHANQEYRKI